MVICNHCMKENDHTHRYCQHCGEVLSHQSELPQGSATDIVQSTTDPTPAPIPSGSQSPAKQPDPPQNPAPVRQMGSDGTGVADIWGPFAGYGERGHHAAWLLDEQGKNAQLLRDSVTQRFAERRIPKARVQRRTLQAKGVIVERRPYYLVQRGITIVGLYIAQFGEDLFISQVTYSLGPIDPLRVIVLVIMLLFQLFAMFSYGSSLQSAVGSFDIFGGYSGSVSSIGLLLCCVGPLALVNSFLLVLASLYSVYKFITEKDILALLRRQPNEFELDDTIALQKSVEETVRQSLDIIGLGHVELTSLKGYGLKRRLI